MFQCLRVSDKAPKDGLGTGTMVQEAQEDTDSGSWIGRMAQQLSGVTVIIIIAGGVLTFLLLFIFAKRQIMRFALRSHRGPHTPIGTDATKAIRREILRRIEAIPKIIFEPQALREETEGGPRPSHFYRMKVLDDTKYLEQNIVKKKLGKRQCFESLRCFFIFVFTPGVDPRLVHQFCDSYEAARFKPKPFNEEEYKIFQALLEQLMTSLGSIHPKSSSMRSPGKSSGTSSSSGSKGSSGVTHGEININVNTTADLRHTTGTTAYVRRVTKEKRSKWAQQQQRSRSSRGSGNDGGDADESEALHCDESDELVTLHEISIIPATTAAKDQSTVL